MDPEKIMELLTRECRDLLDVLKDKDLLKRELTADEKNQLIRDHFSLDMSGYGIAVEEGIDGLTEEKRIEVVDRVLSSLEYQS